jgi:hypothetical protein
MKIKQLLEELEKTEGYRNFKEKYPESFFMAGFFVIDFSSEDQYQLDFFIPGEERIASFERPFGNVKIYEDKITNVKKLNQELKIDFDDLIGEVEKVILDRKIGFKTAKIIAILKDDEWNLTCMSSTLGMFRIVIGSLTGEIRKFEKLSLIDIMHVKKK